MLGRSCFRRVIGLWAAVTVTALLSTPSTASSVPPWPAQQVAQPDSQSILKQLRSAQSRFERIHRSNLPFASGTGTGRCDERVGRFCYWHDDDDSWKPQEEYEEVTRARERLLQQLDSAAVLLRGDRWIAGQRVRYLIEAKQPDTAFEVARHCQADNWWCSALEGYVLHVRGDYSSAEAAFDLGIAAMSAERGCEWRDISLLLEGKSRGAYEDLDCDERADFQRRFWWLSDPLFIVPGNERRTEHYSRVVMGMLLAESDSPRSIPWGRDNVELLYRYGRIIGWQRRYSSRLSTGLDRGILGHHRSHSWRFEPTADFLSDVSEIAAGDWDLEPERPRTRYAVEYATDFRSLQHVLSVFRQGSSAVVVARCETPAIAESTTTDGDSSRGRWESALVVVASESSSTSMLRGQDCRAMAVTVPIAPALVSVEALSRSDSVAARDRYWLDIPARLGSDTDLSVSDLMPIQPGEELPVDLAGAMPVALPSTELSPGDEMGLYWEVYGLDPTWNSVEISLSVEKVGKGFFRRVAEWAGVVGKRSDRIRMRWTEHVPATVTLKRAITLRLTPSMDGTYVIQLAVRAATGEGAVTTRLIRVGP